MGAVRALAKWLAWCRLVGVLSMFVVSILMLSQTGGVGWFVFSRDAADFSTVFKPEIYNKEWFKPMCVEACKDPPQNIMYGSNNTGNADISKPDTTSDKYSSNYGCSFKKKWACGTAVSQKSGPACRDLSGLIPQFWFEDKSEVSLMQNASHMCLSGLYLPYSPFSIWRDCVSYNIEENPDARLAVMWRANWVFFAALCISVVLEIVLLSYQEYLSRHGSDTAKRVGAALYHLFVGILAIMLGGLTIDTQSYYRDEMDPSMISSVADANGKTYEPYNTRLSCFNSDSAMLVWNSALTLHKAGRENAYDIQYVSEYSIVYVSFLLGFGIIFIVTIPLLWMSNTDNYEYGELDQNEEESNDEVYIPEKGWYRRTRGTPGKREQYETQPGPPAYEEESGGRYVPGMLTRSMYADSAPAQPEPEPEPEPERTWNSKNTNRNIQSVFY